VDDERTVRTITSKILENFGFQVILANDGDEAIEKFREHRDKIVSVLMDLTMPKVDGEEAFRQLRAIDPAVKVILMSGFNEQEAVRRFTGKGLGGFLQKPFRPDALRAKLQELLGGASGAKPAQ
jgi:CheY-like chemotaxis protein